MFASTHTVQAGDTLSAIAAQSGVSLAALEGANSGISNPNVIYAGQSVVVPSGGSFAQWSPNASPSTSPSHASVVPSTPSHVSSSGASSKWTPTSPTKSGGSSVPESSTATSPTSPSTTGGIDDIPGVPSSFVKCVAFRESTNGTNAAYNGGTYGIIDASGHNVNGQSLGAQKQAFKEIYDTTGPSAWSADGCPGT